MDAGITPASIPANEIADLLFPNCDSKAKAKVAIAEMLLAEL